MPLEDPIDLAHAIDQAVQVGGREDGRREPLRESLTCLVELVMVMVERSDELAEDFAPLLDAPVLGEHPADQLLVPRQLAERREEDVLLPADVPLEVDAKELLKLTKFGDRGRHQGVVVLVDECGLRLAAGTLDDRPGSDVISHQERERFWETHGRTSWEAADRGGWRWTSTAPSGGDSVRFVEKPSPGDVPSDAGSFLDGLPAAVRARLLKRGVRRACDADTVLLVQGGDSPGLIVVESGLLKVSSISEDGREQVLRHTGAGGSLNEVAALDGGTSPATVVAVEPSLVVVISADALADALAESPELALALLRSFAGRMRHLVGLVEDLSFRHVSERVARILLQSVAPHPGVGAGAELRDRMTQREIAEMAGTSREVVARALRSMEALGAITIERGEIRLLSPERLSQLR